MTGVWLVPDLHLNDLSAFPVIPVALAQFLMFTVAGQWRLFTALPRHQTA